jgi:hypothetical protein
MCRQMLRLHDELADLTVRYVGYRLIMRTTNWLQCNGNEPSFSLQDGLFLDQLSVNLPKTFLVSFPLV